MEISVAVNYILSHLYTKLPRRRVDSFGEELERYLHTKFQYHWFPNDPVRDASLRCLNVSGPHVDLLFPEAATVSGLDWNEIQACLPEGLVITIDPGHVACQYHHPVYSTPDFNRFGSAPLWPSAPLSLSSSGCSSASSSISSTNVTPNAGQVTHQVLYSVQDSWFTSNSAQDVNDNSLNAKKDREVCSEADHDDNLATATALSVLTDNEDNVTLDINHELQDSKDCVQNKIWGNKIPLNQDAQDAFAMHLHCDTGFNSMESSKLELRNGVFETKALGDIRDLCAPGGADVDNALLSILNAELPGYTTPFAPNIRQPERLALFTTLGKSLTPKNPAETVGLNSIQEHVTANSGSNGSGLLFQPVGQKYDQNSVQPIHPRFNSLLTHPLPATPACQYVQKSTSTPSFTAATFAQTKFGSTKLKNHSKRAPNRIFSPTVASQPFTNAKANPVLQRESIVAALLGANQRSTNGSSVDPSMLGRFHTAGGTTGKPILSPGETGFSMDGNRTFLVTDDCPGQAIQTSTANTTSATATSTGLINLTGDLSSNHSPETANQPGLGQNHCAQARQHGKLTDEYVRETITGSAIQPGVQYGFVDMTQGDSTSPVGLHRSDNLTPYWPNSRNRNAIESQGSFTTDDDWVLQPNMMKMNDRMTQQSRTKPLFFQSALGHDDHPHTDDVMLGADDALLSARMVNLLLEEEDTRLGDVATQSDYFIPTANSLGLFKSSGEKTTDIPLPSRLPYAHESERHLGCELQNANK